MQETTASQVTAAAWQTPPGARPRRTFGSAQAFEGCPPESAGRLHARCASAGGRPLATAVADGWSSAHRATESGLSADSSPILSVTRQDSGQGGWKSAGSQKDSRTPVQAPPAEPPRRRPGCGRRSQAAGARTCSWFPQPTCVRAPLVPKVTQLRPHAPKPGESPNLSQKQLVKSPISRALSSESGGIPSRAVFVRQLVVDGSQGGVWRGRPRAWGLVGSRWERSAAGRQLFAGGLPARISCAWASLSG
ncbi:hypothetical protein SAMN05443377_10124 [Propionibacterium cyclohexanicum]|uniref:Uncharacterized protein n=1 Tax=Propionibacterium cyclohexanicum TaxID=64702 RepID=A0A1H9PGJ7_9ACTN|nr:hypothetical protein SAMN05443377_10124 [Propionibacterium cyclohexanicum]